MGETFKRYQKDTHNIKGAMIIDICKSNIDGRKAILIKTKDGKLYHIEPQERTKLTIAKQIKYNQLKPEGINPLVYQLTSFVIVPHLHRFVLELSFQDLNQLRFRIDFQLSFLGY